MRQSRLVRLILVLVVGAAFLVLATAASAAWHQHEGASNANCRACQAVHQSLAQGVASPAALSPLLAVCGTVSDLPLIQASRTELHSPSRSPPSA